MQKEEIQEYVEGLLRDSIYQKKTDVDICVKNMVYQKIPTGKKKMINSLFGRRYEEQYIEFYILDNRKFCDFMYGIQINDNADIEIRLGGKIFFLLQMKKDILFYLPYPIFVSRMIYHDFEVFIHKHTISKNEIEIKLFGIQGDSKILKKISSLYIYDTRYISGMIGQMICKNKIPHIEYVNRDFGFDIHFSQNKYIYENEVEIDLDKSGIIWFHIKNNPELMYKEELIEKAWHPSRFQQWCI